MGSVRTDLRLGYSGTCHIKNGAAMRLKREDWLRIGLTQLAGKGAHGLSLEAMCAAADKTRGSFYHHFTDHDAFIEALMDHWLSENTIKVINRLGTSEPISHRREALNRIVAAFDHNIEVAVRRFAAANDTAQGVVHRADQARLDYLELLLSSGSAEPAANLRMLVEIEYAMFVGYQTLFPNEAPEKYEAVGRMMDAMIGSVSGTQP